MELDPKIKDKSKIFTPFDNTEFVDKYIGVECYFCDDFLLFNNLLGCSKGVLRNVNQYLNHSSFVREIDGKEFKYCLPIEFVEEEIKEEFNIFSSFEKESIEHDYEYITDPNYYRPYTFEEFYNLFEQLKPIIIRPKDNKKFEYHTVYLGYEIVNCYMTVIFANFKKNLKELFDNYEWFSVDSNKWEMFGTENEERVKYWKNKAKMRRLFKR